MVLFRRRRILKAWLLASLALVCSPWGLGLTGAQADGPSQVGVLKYPDGGYHYIVNGREQVFIGMGYNPIYRALPDATRATNYARDFKLLCQAGVNHITGWDYDKGFQQDQFDELTLNSADRFGIGVIMPFYLPPDGNYDDPTFVEYLLLTARAKVERFKNHPALRMWGLGNEVLSAMPPDMYPAFGDRYLALADEIHALDPNHPVIYREAEDEFVPVFSDWLRQSGDMRPWLLYGMNIYSDRIDSLLSSWPDNGLDRPALVSEFGADASGPNARAQGYGDMWREIRTYSRWVIGGAPYVWSTDGPEPTDKKWGLMSAAATPIDGTFALLGQLWRREQTANGPKC